MYQQNLPFEFKGSKEEIYICQQLIASGSEGQVYKGIRKDQPQLYLAIKFSFDTSNDELQFLYKLQKKQQTDNPFKHIIKYFDVIQDPKFLNNQEQLFKKYCFIMELGEKNLLEEVIQTNNYSENQKIEIIYQIAVGIQELHSVKQFHRDIKPENIIKIGDAWKLCDFGFLKHQISQNKTQNVGTPYYIAPEVFKQDSENFINYDQKIDVWSLGCIIYEIITGQLFFSGNSMQEIQKQIQNYCSIQKFNPLNQNTDQRFKNITNPKLQLLCKGMITVDSQKRYDILQVLQKLSELRQIPFTNVMQFPLYQQFQQTCSNQVSQNFQGLQNTFQQQIYPQNMQTLKTIDNKFQNSQNFTNNPKIQTLPAMNHLFYNNVQNQQNTQYSKQISFSNQKQTTQQQFPQFQQNNLNNFQNNQQIEFQYGENIDSLDMKKDNNQIIEQQKIILKQQFFELLSKSLDKVIKIEYKKEIQQFFDSSNDPITNYINNLDDKQDKQQIEFIAEKLTQFIKKRVDMVLQQGQGNK